MAADFLNYNIIPITMEENPFPELKIASSEFLDTLGGRSKCAKCQRSRKYYCYTCYVPVTEIKDKVPKVKLPLKIDIIKHPSEVDGKSTAVHAAIIASEDVTIYTYPCIPDFGDKTKVVILFPGKDSVTLQELVQKSVGKVNADKPAVEKSDNHLGDTLASDDLQLLQNLALKRNKLAKNDKPSVCREDQDPKIENSSVEQEIDRVFKAVENNPCHSGIESDLKQIAEFENRLDPAGDNSSTRQNIETEVKEFENRLDPAGDNSSTRQNIETEVKEFGSTRDLINENQTVKRPAAGNGKECVDLQIPVAKAPKMGKFQSEYEQSITVDISTGSESNIFSPENNIVETIAEYNSDLQSNSRNTGTGISVCDVIEKKNGDACETTETEGENSPCKGRQLKSTVPECPFERVVFVDSTWNQTRSICKDERLKGIQCVELKTRETKFWRHQKDIPNTYLSTIEAIYYFLREYHDQFIQTDYNGEYDNMLFFFVFMYSKIRNLYDGGDHLEAYKNRKQKK